MLKNYSKILGSLSASFTVFLGVQCGYTLLIFQESKSRVKRWLSWALLTGLPAGIYQDLINF